MCKAKSALHIRTASTTAEEYSKAKTTNRRLHKIFDTSALIALFTLFFLGNDGYGERKGTSTLSYPPPLAEISVDSLVAGW